MFEREREKRHTVENIYIERKKNINYERDICTNFSYLGIICSCVLYIYTGGQSTNPEKYIRMGNYV